jgi:hypothetical protein
MIGARRLTRAGLMGLALGLTASGMAAAQSCNEDFMKLSSKRNGAMGALQNLVKAGKGKMDPVAACPLARRLVSVENEMMAYMAKNKEWCSIPDQMVEQFKQGHSKNQSFASQACSVAEKAKKMQQQQRDQAANGGMMAPPKLPAGPL